MDVTVEHTSDVRRRVKLVVPATEVSRVYKQVLAKVGSRARIKGFRPGKAPRKLLERRFGPVIREEVLERVLTKNIGKALDDQKLEPMGQPELDEVGELRDGQDLALAFSVEVLPELELTGWQGVELTVPPCEADDEDLQQELQQIADGKATIDAVDGPVADGDQVQVRYQVGDDEATERRFVAGGEGYEAWVAGALAEVKVGDSFEVPEYEKTEENDARPDPQQVKGEILEIKRRTVPSIDDDLAKADGRCASLEELKAELQAEHARRAERRTVGWKRDAALDHVLVQNRFDVPRALVEREVDHRLSRTFGPQALQKGSQLAQILGEMRETMRAEARDQVRRALIIRHVIADKELTVTDEEIDAQIEKMLSEMKDLPEKAVVQLKSEEGREQSKDMLLQEKALDALLAEVTIVAGEPLRLRDPAPQTAAAETPAEESAHDHDHDHGPAHGEEGHVHGPDCNHDH